MTDANKLGTRILVWLKEFVSVIKIIRVPVLVTLLVCAILTLPTQTGENYRVIVQDMWIKYYLNCGESLISTSRNCSQFDLVRESVFSLLGLLAVSLAVWYVAHRFVINFRGQVPLKSHFAHRALEWSPRVLITLLLLASAWGIYAAIPYQLDVPHSGLIQEIAEHKAVSIHGRDSVTSRDLAFTSTIVQKLTLFAGMLKTAAGILVGLAVISLLVVPRLRRGQPSFAGAPAFLPRWGRLFVFAFIGVLLGLSLLSPVSASQFLGPIALFSLFAVCLIFLLGQLSFWSDKKRVPLTTILLLWAVVIAFLGINNNHNIRVHMVHEGGDGGPKKANTQPPTLREQLSIWYASRRDAKRYQDVNNPKPYPVYVVAAQGGGVYAAYHSARLLATLQDRCPAFGHHLFAISSVSGGSVGASLFAALRLADTNAAEPEGLPCLPATTTVRDLLGNERSLGEAVNATLGNNDLLSPLLSGLLFPDFLQRFLPFPVRRFDRSIWLEFAFEEALQATFSKLGKKNEFWKKSVNFLKRPYVEHWNPNGSTPALIINTTEVHSGERRVIAPFVFGTNEKQFLPIWGAPDGLIRITLSTAAVLSARFPWMTPSGWFIDKTSERDPKVHLVDGGYYDNSGVAGALELKESIETAARELGLADRLEVKLIVLTADVSPPRASSSFDEALDPVRTMLHSWGTRSHHTIEQARGALNRPNGKTPVLRVVHLEQLLYPLPLGWRLSAGTIYLIDSQDPVPGGCVDDAPSASRKLRFEADCALKDLTADLR
jgi:hypothetical protein